MSEHEEVLNVLDELESVVLRSPSTFQDGGFIIARQPVLTRKMADGSVREFIVDAIDTYTFSGLGGSIRNVRLTLMSSGQPRAKKKSRRAKKGTP